MSQLRTVQCRSEDLLEALPVAVYLTDTDGCITFYNRAAAELWGTVPPLGGFHDPWKLYRTDGTPLPSDEHPVALALRERRLIKGIESIAERPDGSRVPFLAFPAPLFDDSGRIIGAINMLVDLTAHRSGDETAQRLAAIIESSDDAILAKDLNGTIISWNRGAERLFGYTAEEAVGKSVSMLIPVARHNEEPEILARIRRGERIDHYETIRRHKNGNLIEISLSVSPVRNARGVIVGASKIARDISERKRAEERQALLIQEMDHRIKNLFGLASGVVAMSARSAKTVAELATSASARLNALARAHGLTLSRISRDEAAEKDEPATLHSLIEAIMAPYERAGGNGASRAVITGCDVPIADDAITSLALLLHEFATNAAKYGPLCTLDGHIDIDCSEEEANFIITWVERSKPVTNPGAESEGFGTRLTQSAVRQLGGEISREWRPEGLWIRISIPRERLSGAEHSRPI